MCIVLVLEVVVVDCVVFGGNSGGRMVTEQVVETFVLLAVLLLWFGASGARAGAGEALGNGSSGCDVGDIGTSGNGHFGCGSCGGDSRINSVGDRGYNNSGSAAVSGGGNSTFVSSWPDCCEKE